MFAIRRMEFLPIEIAVFAIPLLLSARSIGELGSLVVLEGYLAFFVVVAVGTTINCLTDRELDRTYKSRLSSAVDHLGVPFVTALVIIESVLSLALGAHLAWVTGR